MKKSFFKSLLLAVLFIAIGAGLILYSYSWNHKVYQWALEDSFSYNDDISEIGHGFKFGYYDPALYGTPICIALAVASFWVPAKLRARKAQALAKEQAKQRAFEEKHPHYEAEQFYKGARDAGLSEVETSAGRARLVLYAKNKGLQLTETQAVEQFLLGKSEVERLKEQKKQAKQAEEIRKLESQELNYEYLTTRYAELTGQDKKVIMCRDLADDAQRQVAALDEEFKAAMQRGQDAYHATKQREGDWAVAGGIASGIAGPAAGLAAAADIQRKNAEIRAQNDNLRTAVNTVTGHALMEISSRKTAAEKQLKKWREKEKKAELLLVQEYPAEELLKKLKPELVSAVQSDTGAVLIKAKISAVHGAIYDNVSAVADGTIKAVLWEGDTRVGEALLTLPYDGAKTGGTTLEGICRSGPVAGKEYTVTFEPHKLWMIEG